MGLAEGAGAFRLSWAGEGPGNAGKSHRFTTEGSEAALLVDLPTVAEVSARQDETIPKDSWPRRNSRGQLNRRAEGESFPVFTEPPTQLPVRDFLRRPGD